MKRIFIFLLVVAVMAAALAGCAGKPASVGSAGSTDGADSVESTENTADTASAQQEDSVQPEDAAAQEEKQDDSNDETEEQSGGNVRLVYFEPGYMVLSLHGEIISFAIREKDGSFIDLEDVDTPYQTVDRRGNWQLLEVTGLDEKYAVEDLAFLMNEKTESGEEEKLYTDLGEPMTDEEISAIGCLQLDGHCCYFTADTRYGDNYFAINISTAFIKDRGMTLKSDGITVNNFELFSGDGTPLNEYFDGYEWNPLMLSDNGIWFRFESHDDMEEQNKEKCEELKACEPYILFTGSDGSQQQIPLSFLDDEE